MAVDAAFMGQSRESDYLPGRIRGQINGRSHERLDRAKTTHWRSHEHLLPASRTVQDLEIPSFLGISSAESRQRAEGPADPHNQDVGSTSPVPGLSKTLR